MRVPQLHDRDWLADRYVAQGMTIRQIAAELACTPEAVSVALARNGIRARNRGPAPRRDGWRAQRRARLHREIAQQRRLDARRRQVSREILASRVLAVAHAADAPPCERDANLELRRALIELAAVALEWAERIKPPPTRRER